jgi:superfamily I DNA/RNA helicase
MVQMIPETFEGSDSYAEELLYRAFGDIEGKDDWIVIHSLELSKIKSKAQTEVDFIVIVPKRGIVVVECKGATKVTINGSKWDLKGLHGNKQWRSPITQADEAKREIRSLLKGLGYPIDQVPMARLVWLPFIDSSKFFQTGNQVAVWELAMQAELDAPDKAILRALDEEVKASQGNKVLNYKPTALSVELSKTLANALRTQAEAEQTPAAIELMRLREVSRGTYEQLMTLEVVQDNDQLYFIGEAGSGKTAMLTECAINWAHEQRQVLYLCFNEMLRDEINEKIGKGDLITVMNFNDLMLKLAGKKKNPVNADQKWFDEELPALALEKVRANPKRPEYSAICIDEFQDLVPREAIFWPILELLGDPHRATKIALAGDDEQQIYTSGSRIDSFAWAKNQLPQLVKVSLRTNCRQAPKLTTAIHKILNWKSDTRRSRLSKRIDGKLEVISTTEARQAKDLYKVLTRLMKTYKPENIRVLSPLNTKSVLGQLAKSTENHSGDMRSLKSLTEFPQNGGVINWRSIPKYKGLEDDVVVITDISLATSDWLESHNQSLRNQLYVGLTRARFHAVLLVQEDLFKATHDVDGERV